ncbi:MAG: HAD family hydrolase [Erysipelotrichaceae bacterium]|nr:HAD family hydrolase [Erysipelotrichaceae bacterium]
MKTLYVSDLDGTLLRSNEQTSAYTNQAINELTKQGMIFSYATARSYVTAKKATQGLHTNNPLIVYNGALVIDPSTEDIMIANTFNDSIADLLDDLFQHQIIPIVYAFIDGKEQFSYVPALCTKGMNKFLQTREDDIRNHPVETLEELKRGQIFYLTCIDEPEKCVYHIGIYTKERWLEFTSLQASKSHAIQQLQSLLDCDHLVVFEDGKNDIDMFELADEGYAVSNAHEQLKEIASGVILSNDEDGVAKWLKEHVPLF